MSIALNGIPVDDVRFSGGIKKIGMGDFYEVSSRELDANDQVTGLTMLTGATGFKLYYTDKDLVSASDSIVDNGNVAYNQSITLSFKGDSAAIRKEINEMTKSYLVAVVEYKQGPYKIFGLDSGLKVVPSDGHTSGMKASEFKGWKVTLQSEEADPSYIIDMTSESVDSDLRALFGY